jgi:cytochrome c oxidase assembly protein Cox11
MNKYLKILLYVTLFFSLVFISIQPYNRFCNLSNKCEGIYFFDLFEKKSNQTINLIFEAENNDPNISIEVLEQKTATTNLNQKFTIIYQIHNKSNRKMIVRPNLLVKPANLEKYLIKRECLCFKKHKLAVKEAIIVKAVFKISSDIAKEENFNLEKDFLSVGYSIDKTN